MEVVPAHMYVYCVHLLDALGWLWASTRVLGMKPGTSADAASTLNPEQSPAQKLNFFVCSNFVIPLQSRTGHCQNFKEPRSNYSESILLFFSLILVLCPLYLTLRKTSVLPFCMFSLDIIYSTSVTADSRLLLRLTCPLENQLVATQIKKCNSDKITPHWFCSSDEITPHWFCNFSDCCSSMAEECWFRVGLWFCCF